MVQMKIQLDDFVSSRLRAIRCYVGSEPEMDVSLNNRSGGFDFPILWDKFESTKKNVILRSTPNTHDRIFVGDRSRQRGRVDYVGVLIVECAILFPGDGFHVIVLYPPHVEPDGFGTDFAERSVDFDILIDGPFLVLWGDRENLTPISDFRGPSEAVHYSTFYWR